MHWQRERWKQDSKVTALAESWDTPIDWLSKRKDPASCLPSEIMIEIFKDCNLTIDQTIALTTVNKKWKSLLRDVPCLWHGTVSEQGLMQYRGETVLKIAKAVQDMGIKSVSFSLIADMRTRFKWPAQFPSLARLLITIDQSRAVVPLLCRGSFPNLLKLDIYVIPYASEADIVYSIPHQVSLYPPLQLESLSFSHGTSQAEVAIFNDEFHCGYRRLHSRSINNFLRLAPNLKNFELMTLKVWDLTQGPLDTVRSDLDFIGRDLDFSNNTKLEKIRLFNVYLHPDQIIPPSCKTACFQLVHAMTFPQLSASCKELITSVPPRAVVRAGDGGWQYERGSSGQVVHDEYKGLEKLRLRCAYGLVGTLVRCDPSRLVELDIGGHNTNYSSARDYSRYGITTVEPLSLLMARRLCPNLRRLAVSHVDDRDLANFASMKHLEEFKATCARVTWRGVICLIGESALLDNDDPSHQSVECMLRDKTELANTKLTRISLIVLASKAKESTVSDFRYLEKYAIDVSGIMGFGERRINVDEWF
ncbi:hypothetical protein V1525DRAFT_397970 [Lipomyces kononenkoae]|uniref:Uncharacterized protein n=1 Tax=Lipomyces kononenkoae TaxID=34357 RepID=A0ACC3T6R3_LIPKO